MNGTLQPFQKTSVDIPDHDAFVKSWTDLGHPEADIRHMLAKCLNDELWINSEYQVQIDKAPEHGLRDWVIWHLSIKRIDKQPIHDWRDLQQIKNILVGPEYEAVEVYPAESRKVDSANQYHLWVFYKDAQKKPHPMFPIGWTVKFENEKPINGSVQRPFDK